MPDMVLPVRFRELLFYIFDGRFATFFRITVFMALFYNTLQPLLDSLSLKFVKKNPSFSYGTLRIAGAAGWAITGTIKGQLIDTINITMIFVFSAVSMFLTFLFAFFQQEEFMRPEIRKVHASADVKDIFNNHTLSFY